MKKYIYEVRYYILIQVLCDIVYTISIASIPYIQKILFDNILGEEKVNNIFVFVILMYVLSMLVANLFSYISNIYVWKGALKFELSLKRDFFRSVFNSYSLDKLKEVMTNVVPDIAQRLKDKDNCQTLSGGEKQIVAIMRMLTADTEIFLMDEPFSAVDMSTTELLQKELLSMGNKTIIMVTHKISDELKDFDEIILMESGRIVASGTYNEVSSTDEFKKLKSKL